MRMNHSWGAHIAAVVLGCGLSLAPKVLGQSPATPTAAMAPLKEKMRVLQSELDKKMEQTFALPFGLLEKTKGTYLPDFGLVFSLEVNLYPLRPLSPFSPQPLSAEELEQARKKKLERIAIVKDAVPRLLSEHAVKFTELRPEESVAVVVHLFHVQAEGEKLPTQVVLQVKKSDLDQFNAKKISYKELEGRFKVREM